MVQAQTIGEDVVDGLRMFYGDGSEDAQLWKKKFHLHMLARTAAVAVAQRDRMAAGMFGGYMRPNEAGEEWLATLTEDQQQSWVIIEALFTIRWPPEQRRQESYAEKWEAFETHNLEIEEVGTKKEVNGRKRQAHDIYADELYQLGRRCTNAGTPDVAMIASATRRLPDSIRGIVRGRTNENTSWRDWTDTLRQLTAEEIHDEQSIYDAINLTQARQVDLGTQFSQLQLRGDSPIRQNWQNRNNTSFIPRPATTPIATTPAPRYQPLAQTPPQVPSTPVIPRARLNDATPVQPPPDTPADRARVAQAREAWLAAHPGGHPHANSAYPLSPGTSPAKNGVCSRCGKPETPDHNLFSCRNEPLERREQQCRRNVHAKSRFGRNATMPGTPGTPSPLFWMGTETGDQIEVGEEELVLMLENQAAGNGLETER